MGNLRELDKFGRLHSNGLMCVLGNIETISGAESLIGNMHG